jgi:cobalt-precorrin-5B (C1)-methyltransferase
MDLHSRRGVIDLGQIAEWLREAGASDALVEDAKQANTAQQILGLAQVSTIDLAGAIAERARAAAAKAVTGSDIELDVVVFDRDGNLCGRSDCLKV